MRADRSEPKNSVQRLVEVKVFSQEHSVYSNPIFLLMGMKGGKRAEASQWALEINKMHIGIVHSIRVLEGIMNQAENSKQIVIDKEEIVISNEELYWLMTYLIDNAILRIYACLDKIAQMVRCYFEHEDSGGSLEMISKCGCKNVMAENNCTFGSLINTLNKDQKRNKEIVRLIKGLNVNRSINELRQYRNAFTHRKHDLDRSAGLDPKVKANYNENGSVSTMFSFGGTLPSINWFRVEIVNANNAIVECVEKIGQIIFPRDFKIDIKSNKTEKGA